jgi:hypothetical protein
MDLPPPTFEQQALIEHVSAVLARALPLAEGPYALVLQPLPADQRETWGGQAGPVLRSENRLLASVQFRGITERGEPWTIDDELSVCDAEEADHARVERTVQAWARVSRRAMRDASDTRFGDRRTLTLGPLCAALGVLRGAPRSRTRTLESCEAVLLESSALRGILAPEPEVLEAALARLDAWLEEHATLASAPGFELCHVRNPSGEPRGMRSPLGVEVHRHGLLVTVHMITYEPDGNVRDIKEQQLFLVPAAALGDPDRLIAFLEGWTATLPRAIGTHFPEVDLLMPHDLFDIRVLGLKTPRTAEDFAVAFARRWKLAPEAG